MTFGELQQELDEAVARYIETREKEDADAADAIHAEMEKLMEEQIA